MKQKQLGKSDLWISEIGFGCMSLGTNEAQALNLLERAFELGISFFDTADLYDRGLNEKFVGRAFKHKREKIILATKVGNRWNDDGKSWRWDPSPDWIKEGVMDSLERLQTDYIDLYQLHGGTLDDPIDDIIATFEQLRNQGIIRAYGISSIRPNVIREWLKRSKLSSVMMQYSLLDRRPEETVLDLLAKQGVSVIARGPVAKGLLSDKPAKAYLEHSEAELATLQTRLDDFVLPNRSRSQLALRYALAHPAVASVIPGASNLNQLEENIAAQTSPDLSKDEVCALRKLAPAAVYSDHR
ncbi:MAG: aldo/keto reductase [Trueperaceae bacterium]|nr:aldo/keto reductase [Trueperaceae bacterium]